MKIIAAAKESGPAEGSAAALEATAPELGRGRIARWYAGFAVFAGVIFVGCGQPVQWTWGAWAAGGYALAALTAALWRSHGREAALIIALAGALAAPLTWQVTFGRRMSKVGEGPLVVVARSGALLLRHGTPYLSAAQISHVLAFDPYEPAMAIFGLPGAVGLRGAAGNPRLWLGLTAVMVLGLAFHLARPGRARWYTAYAFGSPVLALQLTTGQTDLPVLALLCLMLACADAGPQQRRARLVAGIALGAACAMKATAWPALPVMAAMFAARDGARGAVRFTVTAAVTAVALMAATAPATIAAPTALFQNTVLYPLGLARYLTMAASPLPGHLLAATGPAGRWTAISLLLVAALTVAVSLLVRPPADLRGATWRLSIGLAALFTLAPASRWGYFVYPAALLGFLALASPRQPAAQASAARTGES